MSATELDELEDHLCSTYQAHLGEGLLPGFQAIRVALEEGGWSMFSALTNLMMLATMWRVSGLGRRPILALVMGKAVESQIEGACSTLESDGVQ